MLISNGSFYSLKLGRVWQNPLNYAVTGLLKRRGMVENTLNSGLFASTGVGKWLPDHNLIKRAE